MLQVYQRALLIFLYYFLVVLRQGCKLLGEDTSSINKVLPELQCMIKGENNMALTSDVLRRALGKSQFDIESFDGEKINISLEGIKYDKIVEWKEFAMKILEDRKFDDVNTADLMAIQRLQNNWMLEIIKDRNPSLGDEDELIKHFIGKYRDQFVLNITAQITGKKKEDLEKDMENNVKKKEPKV